MSKLKNLLFSIDRSSNHLNLLTSLELCCLDTHTRPSSLKGTAVIMRILFIKSNTENKNLVFPDIDLISDPQIKENN